MRYLIEVWLKPRWSLTVLDELVMMVEVGIILFGIGIAVAVWKDWRRER